MVDIVNSWRNEAAMSPAEPPRRPRKRASRTNASRMLVCWKPSARSVPISTTLLATAAYHGANYSTQRENNRQCQTQNAEKFRHCFRLVKIVLGFTFCLDGQPGITLKGSFNRLKHGAVFKSESN